MTKSNDLLITQTGFRLVISIVMIIIAVVLINIRLPVLKLYDLAPEQINVIAVLTVMFIVTYLLSGIAIFVHSVTTLFNRLKTRSASEDNG